MENLDVGELVFDLDLLIVYDGDMFEFDEDVEGDMFDGDILVVLMV